MLLIKNNDAFGLHNVVVISGSLLDFGIEKKFLLVAAIFSSNCFPSDFALKEISE